MTTYSPRGLTDLPRVIALDRAPGLGLTYEAARHAVARFGWQRLGPGVLLTSADPPRRSDWIDAGLLIAGSGAALSGWDSVRYYGLGSQQPPSDTVLILDDTGRHRRFGKVWIRPTRRAYGLRFAPRENPWEPGVPIVSPARAIADTALTYRTFNPVRAMVTSAIQRKLVTPDDLALELARMPRNGSAHLRGAMEDVLNNAHSIAEAEGTEYLLREGAPAFEVNVPVVDRNGTVLWVLDLFWRFLRAVGEIDGREFHFSESDWKNTSSRHNEITKRSLALQHWPPSEIRTKKRVWALETIEWLHWRADELGIAVPAPGIVRPGPAGPVPYVVSR